MYTKTHLIFLINLILRPFKLHWNNKSGLIYQYNIFYGSIGFNITKEFDKVLDFLNLDTIRFSIEHSPKFTMSDFIELLVTCKYTHLPTIFRESDVNSKELLDFHTSIINLIKISIKSNNETIIKLTNNFIPFKDDNKYIDIIDKKFNKKGFFASSIKNFNTHVAKVPKKFIKNKFNGHILMTWIPELRPGKYLADIMSAFKEYKSIETKDFFTIYVKNTPTKHIRLDFVYWYNTCIKNLDIEFKKIPF